MAIDPARLKNMLQQTLDDFRLSRGEQQALRQILEHLDPTAQQWALYRNIAFELAREQLTEQNASELVEWLERVNRVLIPTGESRETARAEAYFSPDDDCVQRIAGLFRSARSSVQVCVFTITDNRISEAIVDAFKRGVDVRIISDDDKSLDVGSDLDWLESSGVPVRFDRSSYHMHHKFALFDRQVLLTGSYNWTRSASTSNEENFVLVHDPRLITRFESQFEKLWDQFA